VRSLHEGVVNIPRCDGIDAVVLVKHRHYGKYLLFHNGQGVHHILVNRVALKGQGLCLGNKSQLMVLLNCVESCDSRQK